MKHLHVTAVGVNLLCGMGCLPEPIRSLTELGSACTMSHARTSAPQSSRRGSACAAPSQDISQGHTQTGHRPPEKVAELTTLNNPTHLPLISSA